MSFDAENKFVPKAKAEMEAEAKEKAEQIAALIADKPLSYEDEFYDEREEIRWQYRSAVY